MTFDPDQEDNGLQEAAQSDMNLSNPDFKEEPGPEASKKGIASVLLSVVMVLVVLAIGAFLAMSLMKDGPRTTRKPPERRARLVEVQSVHFESHQIVVSAMGTVQPAKKINLFPRVNGKIGWLSPLLIPGGHFPAEEKMLQIEGFDYELVIRDRQAALRQAQSNLKIELGQQSVALREFNLLGETLKGKDRDLVLRLPQLSHVRAEVEMAQAALDKARLDLARTTVTAPFNAIVGTQEVDLGAVVTTSTKLATLIGTDRYRVEVLLPVNQLRWIRIPGMNEVESGSVVKVYDRVAWGANVFRKGKVIRLAGELEAQGRMARLLVEIPDPLGRQAGSPSPPHLLIGSFVRVGIMGRVLKQVVALDRAVLRDGDKVWLMNAQDELEVRPVEIVHRSKNQVFVSSGLRKGERLVLTDLAAPLAGMPLRTQEMAKPSLS